MLFNVKTLTGFKLAGIDGEIGKTDEFYFDDHHWTIRYLVADTGNWLVGRHVLISPYALMHVDKKEHHIDIDLTKKQIEESPSLNSDKPVSRQFEEKYYVYYGWPMYWNGPSLWGYYPTIMRDHENKNRPAIGEKKWDSHLRSTHDVIGHHIQATNGEIGHVEDFIIDDETWAIRYLVINTGTFLPGKKVLISPRWIDHVSWDESKVFVNLSQGEIKISPLYTEEILITRDYENSLHEHYKLKGYWDNERDDQKV